MIKKIGIFYFSGTGNTEQTAQNIKKEFESKSIVTSLNNIEECLLGNYQINIDEFDLIGIGYPIYGFGTPAIIDDFLNILETSNGKKVFIFRTGADYISLNHNASASMIKVLKKKGFKVIYDRTIVITSNWLVGYDDRAVKQLYNCSLVKVRHMCLEIINGIERFYYPGLFLRILTHSIHYMESRFGAKEFGRSLTVNSQCNNCGICYNNCPRKNITDNNGKIKFGRNCIWCMRCIYSCPQKAINSRGMSFFILKNGYDFKKIIKNTVDSENYITAESKGYMKHFYKYLLDETL